jgi:hypothetical protein
MPHRPVYAADDGFAVSSRSFPDLT